MAILNVTPDSFSDGGSYGDAGEAAGAGYRFADAGADIIDVGGESTRPGAERVGAGEQIRRVVPVVERLRAALPEHVAISVDTTLSAVARAALDAGADAVNDVSAGTEDEEMFALVASRCAGLVVMHRLRPPPEDRYSDRYDEPPRYGDVVREVAGFLRDRAARAEEAGVARESICVDPGLGFGKTVDQNLELIARTGEIAALGYPVLSGISRKSFVGRVSGLGDGSPARSRVSGSVALSVVHRVNGASVFRVHDVGAHVEALRAADAALRAGGGALLSDTEPPKADFGRGR